MKRLTLFRHGKSSWEKQEIPDHDRPLSGRGFKDAPRMGERLRVRKARPSLIVTSSAKRARQTAKLVAKAIGYPREFLQVEPELYLATPVAMLHVVAALDDEFADVMLIGHNPGMTDLANRLVADFRLDNLPTAGLVAIDFRVDRWSELAPDLGTLVYYDYPKNPEVLIGLD